ncbi:hypothetical protein ACXYMW_03495 [Roseivivax sp. CAU 1761]
MPFPALLRIPRPAAPQTRRTPARAVHDAADSLPVLLLAAAPLLLGLLSGSVASIVGAVLHFGLLCTAVALIAAGHRVAREFDAAEAARRPAIPRKLLGCAVIGLMVFLLAAAQLPNWLPPVFYGLAATGFAVAAFGPDPLRDKGLDTPAYRARQAADRMLGDTDAQLRGAATRVAALGAAGLTHRTEAMHGAVMRLLRAFAERPEEMMSLSPALARFTRLVEAEVTRLEAVWDDDPSGAAERYAARLKALTAAFESGARARRRQETPDAFALEADLIAVRLRSQTAA